LSRFFRLYEKKRGDRRTGSKAIGSLGEALFFGIFFAVGCGAFAYMLAALAWPEWRANRQFAQTRCTIVAEHVGRAEAEGEPATYRPEFRIRYKVGDQEYVEDGVFDVTQVYTADEQTVKDILNQFDVGGEYDCWYDPIDPHRVVLARGYSPWLYVSLLIPLSFIIIGGGRLIYTLLHWNASDERRALLNQRAAQLDLFEVDTLDRGFPTVPTDSNLTNSPGTTLAYRLPIATTTGWKLFAAAAACVLWNGIVAIFIVMAANSFAQDKPDWPLVLFIVPFVIAGLGLLVYLIRQIMITTGVGPTRVEISAHPLAPGEPYELFLSQAGRLAMNWLEVWLACDEKASFRQGTDTRTETRRVYEDRCFVRSNFEIHQGLPFESRCSIRVPAGAMHSFQANHNEVSWKLVVKGSVIGWPDYQREFQIVVNPTANGHSHS
jgi:hypothetical protein